MFVIDIQVDPFAAELEVLAERAEGAVEHALFLGVEHAADAGVDAAKRNHQYRDGTTALRGLDATSLTDSIHADPPIGGGSESTADMVAGKETASFLEEGTRPHTIEPRDKEALRWWDGGEHFAKRVEHPGTRPYFFMRDAAVVAEQDLERTLEKTLPAALRKIFKAGA